MPAPKVQLRRAVHISPKSVFFIPKEGESLDFATIGSAPPAHREVLQKNGLIAKAILTVSPNIGPGGDEMTSTREGRLQIWWEALYKSGLIDAGPSGVTMPVSLSEKRWPILNGAVFEQHMEAARCRQRDETMRECPSVVPVLAVHEFVHKEKDVKVILGVIWMPRYRWSFRDWGEQHLRRRFVSEWTVKTMVNQLTIGLLALRASGGVSPFYLTFDDILVHGEDAEPSFLLTLTEPKPSPLLNRNAADLNAFPFLSPELVNCADQPLGSPKCDVWALGMIAFTVASGLGHNGRSFLRPRRDTLKQSLLQKTELPLNHALVTPSDILRRVRAGFQPGSYSATLVHLVVLMLSQDPLTRPSLRVVDRMLEELLRPNPILRFPFAIGSFDVVRLLNPESIVLNPMSRKYIINDKCILCQRSRSSPTCVTMEHTPAACSPSWCTDELLPGYEQAGRSQMTYLHPLVGKMDDKKQRSHIEAALKGESIDKSALLQLFGGFTSFYTDASGENTVTREVMIPLPCHVLIKKEMQEVALQLNFAAALPWPSECTTQLQKEGRIQRAVPAIFGHGNVKWYAWILPGETFKVGEDGAPWIPSPDGGFVFWFNESLEPTEMDRYFMLCGMRSLTLQAKVERTALPDRVFCRDSDAHRNTLLHSELPSMNFLSEDQSPRRGLRQISSRLKDHPRGMEGRDAQEVSHTTDESPRRCFSTSEHMFPPEKSPLRRSGLAGTPPCRERHPLRRNMVRVSFIDDIRPGVVREDVTNGLSRHVCVEAQAGAANREEFMSGETYNHTEHINLYTQHKRLNGQLSEMVDDPRSSYVQDARQLRQQRQKRQKHKEKQHHLPPPLSALASMEGISPRAAASNPPTPAALPAAFPSAANRSLDALPIVDHTQPWPLSPTPGGTPSVLKVFGRWHRPSRIDAAFQALTFCIPETGEHGRLSIPTEATDAMRRVTHAPSDAARMAFCANEVPLLRRNHPLCGKALPPPEASGLLPHHALVFYNSQDAVVGLLALRFAVTSVPDVAVGEFSIPCKALPPVLAGVVLPSSLTLAYFSGNATFEAVRGAKKEDSAELLRHSLSASRVNGILTISGVRLEGMEVATPSAVQSDDGELPACWVGFDCASRMLLVSDVRQEVWYPLYLDD